MNSDSFNWADIRVFLAVLRHGSTLAAARALDMAQPTVARRVDTLEHATGLTLFDRDTRGFHPTEAAETLRPIAEQLEQSACALADQVATLRQTRPIRITAFSGNLSSNLHMICNAFSEIHPDIALEFLPSVRAFDLMAGEADIALRLTRKLPDPDLIQRHVSTAKFAFFGSPDYVAKYGKIASLDDLSGHRFIMFRREDVPPYFLDWITARVKPEQIVATYKELDLVHTAIRSGRGVSITNIRLMKDDPTVVQCSEAITEMDAQHMILISPSAYRRPEVKTFIKFFAPRYTALYR